LFRNDFLLEGVNALAAALQAAPITLWTHITKLAESRYGGSAVICGTRVVPDVEGE
jgi:hypothetical protein